jgi:hypothetical protein
MPTMAKKSRPSKLSLHCETLRALESAWTEGGIYWSCVESCFDMSCEGGCGLSEGAIKA